METSNSNVSNHALAALDHRAPSFPQILAQSGTRRRLRAATSAGHRNTCRRSRLRPSQDSCVSNAPRPARSISGYRITPGPASRWLHVDFPSKQVQRRVAHHIVGVRNGNASHRRRSREEYDVTIAVATIALGANTERFVHAVQRVTDFVVEEGSR